VEGDVAHERYVGRIDFVLMKIVGRPKSPGIGRPKGSISMSGKGTPVMATVANAQGKRSRMSKRRSKKSV
jgi:hypothetical protein